MRRFVNGHALGRFDDGAGVFAGLVVGERVLRLRPDEVVPGPATVTALLDAWAVTRPRLA